jgi:hypothetical protein
MHAPTAGPGNPGAPRRSLLMGCDDCHSIVHLSYMVCGETDDLEYLVEVADLNTDAPLVTTVALQH